MWSDLCILKDCGLCWWRVVGDRAWGEVWEQEGLSGSYCISLMRNMMAAQSRGWWCRWREVKDGDLFAGGTHRTYCVLILWEEEREKMKDDSYIIWLTTWMGGASISWERNALEMGSSEREETHFDLYSNSSWINESSRMIYFKHSLTF